MFSCGFLCHYAEVTPRSHLMQQQKKGRHTYIEIKDFFKSLQFHDIKFSRLLTLNHITPRSSLLQQKKAAFPTMRSKNFYSCLNDDFFLLPA